MKTLSKISGMALVAIALALTGWTSTAAASDFTKALTKDYFALARVQYYYSHDKFAVKARAADQGKNVLPDDPAKFKKLPSGAAAELRDGHARLMRALNGGFRSQDPKQASKAQTSFDCWLWAVAEKDKKCIGKCKRAFEKALAAWKPPVVMKPKPAPAPVAKPAPAPPPPPRSFIVFFDWNRAGIRADALRVLEAAAAYAKQRGFTKVMLTGHADRSGAANYNMGLSQRRAAAAKAALVKLGLSAGGISTVGKGESAPLVSTSDGVREPRNRRVEINF
ncbi:MAG: OmpA family protein [Alphaproteobacteria bacterium]|nr:OmpA family protein [Alphaproteobacteria bacterium]